MTNFDISIHDKRSEIPFDLNSQSSSSYPTVRSKENIFGKKCYQLKWRSGRERFVAGFIGSGYAEFIDISSSNTIVYIRKPNVADITYSIGSPLYSNKNYLICTDTINQKFLFVDESKTRSFDYKKGASIQSFLFIQEYSTCRDSIVIKIRKPYDIKLPPSYSPLCSGRHSSMIKVRFNLMPMFILVFILSK